MSDAVYDFFRGKTPAFHKVMALHEEKEKGFDDLSQMIPLLPRGWFELSRLSREDRVEFTRDFWLSKLPFATARGSELEERILSFFEGVDDIGIFATQSKEDSPFEAHMVYGFADNTSFFHGFPPASVEMIEILSNQFANFTFPSDYLSFLEIHDGFSKFTDTGLIRTRDMSRVYLRFQELLSSEELLSIENQIIDPKSLIPFYEAFGLHSYQCFFADNQPSSEVTCVYYSEYERSFGSFVQERSLDETLFFSSFLSWLCFYLEDVGFLE